MSDTPLRLEGVTHRYGEVPALDDLSLEVAGGELLAILGPSGCGKTTFLRVVAGLATPAAGRVEIAGRAVCQGGGELVPAERRGVGLVFQSYALFGHMTVGENVGFGLRPADPGRVRALLSLTGLADLAERRPSELSGGQQQRVALARALAPRPHVLLLDEPFANVDAELRAQLCEELRRLLAEEGVTALLVTHDREDALRTADRVLVLVPGPAGGRLAQLDLPEAVYRRPSSEAVARLTGRCSSLPGAACGLEATTALGPARLTDLREGPVTLLLRPEQLLVGPEEGVEVEVRGCAFTGRGYSVRVALGARELWGESAQKIEGGAARARLVGECWALPSPRDRPGSGLA
jgi:iron(III) transport system ATP-binding protein